MDPLTVLIGDLRGSRDLDPEERGRTQKSIQAILARLSRELRSGLGTPLVLTAGDEVQGVFRRADLVVTAIQELTDCLYGSGAQFRPTRRPGERYDWSELPRQEIAFGIGLGTLTAGRLPAPPALHDNPAHLDGSAFHHARSAMERTQKAGGWASFEGFPADTQEILETLFDLMGSLRRDWATAQWVYTYARRQEKYQKDVAERMRISASVVSESLSAAHFDAILRGEEAARRVLQAAKTGKVERT